MPATAVRHRTVKEGTERAERLRPDYEADRVLARRCRDGDRNAFEEIYNKYRPRIFNYALRVSGRNEDAAEATQEAFVAFLRRLPKLDIDELVVLPYLYACARYECLAQSRSRQRNLRIASKMHVVEHTELMEDDPERTALFHDHKRKIVEANARLPERHRTVLALREIGGLDYDQIGEALDLNRNAVAQLIRRSRLRLLDELRKGAAQQPAAGPDCARAEPMLSAYVDRELSQEDAQWLEQHIKECRACDVNLECIRDAVVSYRAWLPLPAVAVFAMTAKADAVMALASRPVPASGLKSLVGNRKLIAAATATVVATGIVLFFAVGDSQDGKPPVVKSSPTKAATHQKTESTAAKTDKSKSDGTSSAADSTSSTDAATGSASSPSGNSSGSSRSGSSSGGGGSSDIGAVDSSPDSQPTGGSGSGSGGSTPPPNAADPSKCSNCN